MTIDEIFSRISQHMVEGLMFHSQLSDYFCFLGFKGYSAFHTHQFFEESNNYRKINSYYLHHFGRIIKESGFNNPKVIPDNWYNYRREDVDSTTRKNSLQMGFDKWVKWETDTLKLYSSMYKELINLNEVAAANMVRKIIKDVDDELALGKQEYLELKAIEFDLVEVIAKQEEKYDRYK